MPSFGEVLRSIRRERGWSLEEMATALGTSKQVLSRYETGQRSPKITTVAEYSEKLCVDLSVLTGGDKEDDELWELREVIRRNPEYKTLFKLARNATPSDIKAAIAVLESLKGARE